MIKQAKTVILTAFLVGLMLSVAWVAEARTAGTASNPLVSKEWVNEYLDAQFGPLETQLSKLKTQVYAQYNLVTFTDVKASDWFYTYVTALTKAKVIDGFPDNTYRPYNKLTYGQALKLVLLAAGYAEQKPSGSHWASGYLTLAQDKGFISGTVKLDNQIDRNALADLAAAALGLKAKGASPFSDSTRSSVIALYEANIIEGYPDGTYGGSKQLSRAEISAIIYRINNM